MCLRLLFFKWDGYNPRYYITVFPVCLPLFENFLKIKNLSFRASAHTGVGIRSLAALLVPGDAVRRKEITDCHGLQASLAMTGKFGK